MEDRRIPLPVGTVLRGAGGAEYTISGAPLGRGGASLAYPAERRGSARAFVIKECYPLSGVHEYVRRGWAVEPAEPGDPAAAAELSRLREGLGREDELGQRLARTSGRLLSAWETLQLDELVVDGASYVPASGGYIALEGLAGGWSLRELMEECSKPPEPGRPLRSGGLPRAGVVLDIMEELLKALRDVHRAGCIHGDVNDGNLYFAGPDAGSGDIGSGRLLDLGSARELMPDGRTAPVPVSGLYAAPGYAAPELLDACAGPVRLSPAADVYSAGCLLLYLLRGLTLGELCADMGAASAPVLSRRRAELRGFRGEAGAELVELLGRALAREPGQRYADAGEFLAALTRLRQLTTPARYRLPPNLGGSAYFRAESREAELERLESELDSAQGPVWLWGIGGIGKTELAKELGRRLRRRGTEAYLVPYRGSIRATVLGMEFSGLSRRIEPGRDAEERRYRERLDILKDWYEDSLLIVDGFEREGADIAELRAEPEYAELCGLRLKLLFTTRSRPDEVTPELGALSEESAYALYESITPVLESGRAQVRELLRALGCHTLAVELSARAVSADWGEGEVTPGRLLAEFRYGEGACGVDVQLRRLFRVTEPGAESRSLLCHATLLPPEGVDAGFFLRAEPPEERWRLRRLEGRGWLRRGRDNVLSIHPLVRSSLRAELQPGEQDCAGFLNAVRGQLEGRYPPEPGLVRQALGVFRRAAWELEDSRGEYAESAGLCCYELGLDAEALLQSGACLRRRLERIPEDKPALARAYLACGAVSERLGLPEEQLQQALAALELLGEGGESAALGLAERLCGAAYLELGRTGAALEHSLAAVRCLSGLGAAGERYLGQAERALGLALAKSGRYGQASARLRTALELAQAQLPARHPDIAELYSRLSECSEGAGRLDEAERYALAALELLEAGLPWDDKELAAAYRRLSLLYMRLGECAKSEQYGEKARRAQQGFGRRTWTKMLRSALKILALDEARGAGRDSLAHDYRRAAESFKRLGQGETARRYIRRALTLYEEAEGDAQEEHLCLFEAGDIAYERGDYETALEYSLRAMTLLERRLPDAHELQSTCALKLAVLYRCRRELRRALDCYGKAIAQQRLCPYPDGGLISLAAMCAQSVSRELDAEK